MWQECYNDATEVCCKGTVCPNGSCDSSGAFGRCAFAASANTNATKSNTIECQDGTGSKAFCHATDNKCCDHSDPTTGKLMWQECYNDATEVCCKGTVCPNGSCDESGAVGRCSFAASVKTTATTKSKTIECQDAAGSKAFCRATDNKCCDHPDPTTG